MEADLAICPALKVFSMRLGTSDNIDIGIKIAKLHLRLCAMVLFLHLLLRFLLFFLGYRIEQGCLLATAHDLHLKEDNLHVTIKLALLQPGFWGAAQSLFCAWHILDVGQ